MRNFTQKLCLTLTLALLLFTSTCFAKVAKDDLCIAGIHLGQPMSEVTSKYGDPVTVNYRGEFPDNCTYSGFRGLFTVGYGTIVRWVEVKGNSRYSTKAGIKIGSTSDEVKSVYGAAEHFTFKGEDENGNPVDMPALRYYVKIPFNTGDNRSYRLGVLGFILDENKRVKRMYTSYLGE